MQIKWKYRKLMVVQLYLLAPQFLPEQFNLTSYNSTCVSLSWTVPKYPGGPLTGYQVGLLQTWKNQKLVF